MASTNTSSGSVSRPVMTPADKQDIRARVTNLIRDHFSTTLGQAFDIVNVFMAIIYHESRFIPNAKGVNYGRSHTSKIVKYSAVANVYNNGTAQQRANIIDSAAAYGLAQVTGYYFIKGCGPGGKCEIERLRPDLASGMLVNPGESVSAGVLGGANIDVQLKAGLIILEAKYKENAPKLVAEGKYSTKLMAAVAAYLGLGVADALGTTPEAYANSVIRGSAYQMANNGRGPSGTVSAEAGGNSSSNGKSGNNPATTAASGEKLSTAGC